MTQIDNTGRSLTLLERVLEITKKYSILEILKALIMLIVLAAILFVTFNPSRIFELYDEYRSRQHDEAMEQRELYTPQIQTALDALLVHTQADRCLFLEYHNGTESVGKLPFKFANAAFEALGDGIYSIADQYKDVNLTLLPFASHINNQGFYSGNIESLQNIDKSLMYKLMSNNVQHFAAIQVEGVKEPLGLLILTYTHPVDHDCSKIKRMTESTARNLALKLELNKK